MLNKIKNLLAISNPMDKKEIGWFIEKEIENMTHDKPSMTTARPSKPVLPSEKKCEHSYKLLDGSTDTFYADGSLYVVSVKATFFCDKCLDLQHKNQTFNAEAQDKGVTGE